tara:strand:+ start:16 stop:459 length:444 start_codon:yes stop_codon:yes gene_type:complete
MTKIIICSIKYLILLFIVDTNLFAEEKQLNCKITSELENGKVVYKRKYKDSNLRIYFNKEFNWINDISFFEFKANVALLESSTFSFEVEKKKINFRMSEYFSAEKISKNIDNLITYDYVEKIINFQKIYYNFDGQIYFTTTVKGVCN